MVGKNKSHLVEDCPILIEARGYFGQFSCPFRVLPMAENSGLHCPQCRKYAIYDGLEPKDITVFSVFIGMVFCGHKIMLDQKTE